MSVSRRISLPFADRRPGSKYFRGFMRRHAEPLKFIRPSKQEYERFKSVNADVLTAHFCTIEKLIKQHSLDPTRIWNLDECGVTPGRDDNGRSQQKIILRSNGSRDIRVMKFSYNKRITFMPVVSAAGEAGPCLFVFKEKRMPYRRIVQDGNEVLNTLSDHLPRRTIDTMREEGGGVDKTNFLGWAEHFVKSIKDLTTGGRKVLLIYDGYRSHMSLAVLCVFAEGGVIVYSLPAHRSGKTQPLDMVAFSTFKRRLKQLVYEHNERFIDTGCTVYDICDLMCAAYNYTFTPSIIQSSFNRSGICPFNPKKLIGVPRPADSSLSAVNDCSAMEEMMNEKRKENADSVFRCKVTILDNGFIDTTKGAVLTTEEAIKVVKEHDDAVQKAKAVKAMEASRRAMQAAKREQKERLESRRLRQAAIRRQALLSRMNVDDFQKQLRSMKERRAQARLCASEKTALRLNK